MVLSSQTFLQAWVGLEVRLFCFLLPIMKSNYNKEVPMVYFITQGVSSLLILACLLLDNDYGILGVSLGLTVKLGAGPFFW